MNIPIYRAKKIDSDEYVIGYYTYNKDNGLGFIWEENVHKIDITTLAIHFPDMTDSQGNKIFASLDEYWHKGASIVEIDGWCGDYKIQHAVYSENCLCIVDKDGAKYNIYENGHKLKVIGIQE